MHGLSPTDPGRTIDWGRTSADYAAHRPGYPASFFARLAEHGIGRSGQRVVDLGTGTGNLVRALARRGAHAAGVDVSSEQIEAARALAASEGLDVDFRVAPAEETGLASASFDVATASMCWLYFERDRAVREVRRLLVPGGVLCTCHLTWLPREDPVARRSEQLVLEHNPSWTAADWSGDVPAFPEWARGDFEPAGAFVYDEPIPFTRASWRGRFRACRGVGAALAPDAVAAFDRAHEALLRATVPERFTVLHRVDAQVMRPRAAL